MPISCPGKEITTSDEHFFSSRPFPFLDLRSEGLSNFATLSNLSALLDNLSFLHTISESESCLLERDVRLHLYSFPGKFGIR